MALLAKNEDPTVREIRASFGDELMSASAAHQRHVELSSLTARISDQMTYNLAEPFTNFVSAYQRYYTGCVESLSMLDGAYKMLPTLIATLAAPKDFRMCMADTHKMMQAMSALDAEHAAMEAAHKELLNTLLKNSAAVKATPVLQAEQNKLQALLDSLRSAEVDYNRQKTLHEIQQEAKADHGKARERIQARLSEIEASNKAHNQRIDQLTEQQRQTTTVREHRRHGWWIFGHSSSTTTTHTVDHSAAINAQRARLGELEQEHARLSSMLTQDRNGLINGTPAAPEAAMAKVEQLRKDVAAQEQVVRDQYTLDAASILAKAALGDRDPKDLAGLVTSSLAVIDKLQFVRAYIVTTKKTFAIASDTHQKLSPQVAILGLTAIVQAPLLLVALKEGVSAPQLINAQLYQQRFLAVQQNTANMVRTIERKGNYASQAAVEVIQDEVKAGAVPDMDAWV